MSTLKVDGIRSNSASSDAITLASDGTCTANITNNLSNRNVIVNGDFQIAQRSSAAVISTHGSNDDVYTTVDRFKYHLHGAAAISSQQVSLTAATDPVGFNYALKIACTTADTSIAASDYAIFQQPVEGYNWRQFNFGLSNAKQLTLSFWVKSNKTGTYCVAFRNNAHNRRYAAEYSISQADTWEKKSITLTGDTTGTWLSTNGGGCFVSFTLSSGSTFQVTGNTWAAGEQFSTSNQVNFTDSTSNTFFITGIQIEQGSVATDFEHRSYGQELTLCQRYYYQNYTSSDGGYYFYQYSASHKFVDMQHPVPMRAEPTATFTISTGGYTVYDGSNLSYKAYTASTYDSASPVHTNSIVKFSAEL